MIFTAAALRKILLATIALSGTVTTAQAQNVPAKPEFKISDPAQDTPAQAAARLAIDRQCAAMDKASLTLDVSAILELCTPDYEARDINGVLRNRAETEMQFRQIFATPGLKVESGSTKIEKIQWFGKEDAIVWTTSVAKLSIGPTAIETTGTSRILWHPINGRWLMKRSVELTLDTTVNGKKMPTQTPPEK